MEGSQSTNATPATGTPQVNPSTTTIDPNNITGKTRPKAPGNPRTAAAPPAAKVAAEAPAQPEKPGFRLVKVDGTDYEVDEKTFRAAAQKSLGAEKRMYEAGELQRKALEALKYADEQKVKYESWEKMSPVEQFESMQAKLNDPETSKAMRGKIEKWLWDRIQEDQMTPEMQKASAAERENADLKKKLQSQEEQQKQATYNAEKQHYAEQAQKDLMHIINTAGLPLTEWNVKRAADLMYNARQVAKTNPGLQIPPEQLANILKQDTIKSTGALYGNIADGIIKARQAGNNEEILKYGSALVEHMPESVIRALRIYDLTKHMTAQPVTSQQRVNDAPKTEVVEKKRPYMSMDDWAAERKEIAAKLQRSARN